MSKNSNLKIYKKYCVAQVYSSSNDYEKYLKNKFAMLLSNATSVAQQSDRKMDEQKSCSTIIQNKKTTRNCKSNICH